MVAKPIVAKPCARKCRAVLSLLGAVLAAAFGAWAYWALAAPAAYAAAPTRAGVARCELGAYFSDLFDIDPVRSRFSARLWLWTICPDRSSDPLPHVSLSNADGPVTSEPHVLDRGGRTLDQVLVQSSFRQEWDVRDFPFDRHRIEVLVTAPDDTARFRFALDEGATGRLGGHQHHRADPDRLAPPGHPRLPPPRGGRHRPGLALDRPGRQHGPGGAAQPPGSVGGTRRVRPDVRGLVALAACR